MVTIITGRIDSGKTTRIQKLYDKTKSGDGFVSRKIMIGTDVYGFNAIRLSDGFEFPFMIHERYYYNEDVFSDETDFQYVYEIGPYKVLKSAMEFIDNACKDMIHLNKTPLYFDEVGMLEIGNLGYAKHIHDALQAQMDVIMTIREDLILDVLESFHITNYEIRR